MALMPSRHIIDERDIFGARRKAVATIALSSSTLRGIQGRKKGRGAASSFSCISARTLAPLSVRRHSAMVDINNVRIKRNNCLDSGVNIQASA